MAQKQKKGRKPQARRRAPSAKAQQPRAATPAPPHTEPVEAPSPPRDLPWLIGTLVISAGLLASTFSGNVDLGDSPESIAGVDSLGVVHAPGYPSYIAFAKLFSTLVPVGELALRVNLFSSVCALGAVAGLFALARRLGASAPAAAFSGLALATATSVWFYAGFAKHYAFSTMLTVVAWWAIIRWFDRRSIADLTVAAVAFGALFGSSWQLAALSVPAIGIVLVTSGRNWLRDAIRFSAIAAVVGLLALGLMYARGQADPAINEGAIDSVGDVVNHFTLRDFGYGPSAFTSGDTAAAEREVGGSNIGRLPRTLRNYTVVLSRELNIAILLLAVLGLVITLRRDGARWLPRVAFASNILGAAMVIATWRVVGYGTVLRQGGYLAGSTLALCVAAGLGLTGLLNGAMRRAAERRSRRRGALQNVYTAMGRLPVPSAQVGAGIIVGAAALLVLVPGVLVHRGEAEHRGPNHAAAYANDVFDLLPKDAVLVSRGLELSFPLRYRQVVENERTDVDIVLADGLGLDWYREQLAERSGLEVQTRGNRDPVDLAVALVRRTLEDRPVFLDMAATEYLRERLPYEVRGIVAEVVPANAPGAVVPDDYDEVAELAETYDDRVLDEPRRGEFPYALLMRSYRTLHYELGRVADMSDDIPEAKRQLEAVLRLDPKNQQARQSLTDLDTADDEQ